MDANRSTDPLAPDDFHCGLLDDAALDRAIQIALDINPSPQFQARVRMLVANEARPVDWQRPLMFVANGAFAVILSVAAVMTIFERERIPHSQLTSTSSFASTPQALGERVDAERGTPATAETRVASNLELRKAAPVYAAPAVFSPAEVAGLRQLARMAEEGDASLRLLLAPPTLTAVIGPEGELTIPSLGIEPLVPEIDPESY
jgi:hypothetical protein